MAYARSGHLRNYNKRGGPPEGCVVFRTTYDAASNEIFEDKVDIRTLSSDDICRPLPRKADIVTVLYYRSENDTRYDFERVESPESPSAAAVCTPTEKLWIRIKHAKSGRVTTVTPMDCRYGGNHDGVSVHHCRLPRGAHWTGKRVTKGRFEGHHEDFILRDN